MTQQGVVDCGELEFPTIALEAAHGGVFIIASATGDIPLKSVTVSSDKAGSSSGPLAPRWKVKRGDKPGELQMPFSCIRHESRLYVAEWKNNRIEAYDVGSGEFKRTIATVPSPRGLVHVEGQKGDS